MRRLLAALFLLAACAGGPDGGGPSPYAFADTEAPDPAPLSGYDIPRGQCGLILWSKSGSTVAPIFRLVGGTSATMRIEGEEVPLSLQDSDGEIRLGIRANQRFAAAVPKAGDLQVATRLRWGPAFPGGTYIERGTVTVTGSDGWSRILPVAGVAGCKR